MHTHDALPLLICLLLLLGVWLYQFVRSFPRPARPQESPCAHVPRCLKPRSPLDCPVCCLAASAVPAQEPTRAPVRPWREVKSQRGAPKRANTKGVACPNRACVYYRISEGYSPTWCGIIQSTLPNT
jgi:hypothetical protein